MGWPRSTRRALGTLSKTFDSGSSISKADATASISTVGMVRAGIAAVGPGAAATVGAAYTAGMVGNTDSYRALSPEWTL